MINFSSRPPSVSVVMPVYNSEKFVSQAVQSILDQSFLDFEFIIIDDCSTDQSREILESFRDKKIKLVRQQNKTGQYVCRNIGMKLARGKYIAVMDADDISLPQRLEKQYAWLENNPETGICGTFIQIIPFQFRPIFITDPDLVKVAFISNNHCSHPSLMIRNELLKKYDLRYEETIIYAADFDLCVRALRYSKIQNIPEILVYYRNHSEQISTAKFSEQQMYADKIRINQLIENLSFKLIEIPVEQHLLLMRKLAISVSQKEDVMKWIDRIVKKNMETGFYDGNKLSWYLNQLANVCFSKNCTT